MPGPPLWTLARTLDRVVPWLAPPLVDPAALERLRMLANGLPASLASTVYVEPRMAAGPSRVDLIARLDGAGRELLVAGTPWAPALARQPSWARAVAFARAWDDARGALARAVRCAWLEFDLDREAADALLRPRAFVDLARDAYTLEPPAARAALVAEALEPLSGGPLVPESRAVLDACVRALPARAFAPYAGLAVDGAGPVVRLCVMGLGERACAFLDAIGWPGDTRALRRDVLEPFAAAGAGDAALLHVDLAPDVSARIGLEFTLARAAQARGAIAEIAFLDHLVSRGLCGTGHRDVLLRWAGRTTQTLDHEVWPSVLRRVVGHVKAVVDPNGLRETKVYLRLAAEPLRRRVPVLEASQRSIG